MSKQNTIKIGTKWCIFYSLRVASHNLSPWKCLALVLWNSWRRPCQRKVFVNINTAAYFFLWRSRQRTHFVEPPFSPKCAHDWKFLHPLHHLIWSPESFTTQIFTSHRVQRPLFWFGMTTVSFAPFCDWVAFIDLVLLDFPTLQLRASPHMTQRFVP